MAKSKPKPKPKPVKIPTPYELLGLRIQAAINTPKAQLSKSVLLERAEGDDPADWDQILSEIGENENVTLNNREDGMIHLAWTAPKED